MSDVQIHFLDPINDYLGKPAFRGQTAARLAGFAEDLSEEALRAAAEEVIRTMTGTPKLATLQKALAKAHLAATVPMDTSVRDWDYETKNRLEWEAERDAIRLIREQGYSLAMAADRGGYLKRLVEFVSDHGRLPLAREIDEIRRRSAAVLAEVEREDNGDLGPHVQRLHANMLDAIGRKVLGDDALVRAADITVLKGRQRSAGESYHERRKAEAKLTELAADVPVFGLSPDALKIFEKRR